MTQAASRPIRSHNLGYPRIGAQRELKFALEACWRGDIDIAQLQQTGRELRHRHWQQQRDAGLDLVPVGDFSFYDQVLDMSCMLGAIPPRFAHDGGEVSMHTRFCMARGRAPDGSSARACEMTKWFDTNYHYLVPELSATQRFYLASTQLFDEVREAQQAGHAVKPVVLGPLSWLWLGKGDNDLDVLSLLDKILPVYQQILQQLAGLGVEWVQIDEPILVLDLPAAWQSAFESVYFQLQRRDLKLLLTTYFGGLGDNLNLACRLPVAGLHIDAIRGAAELDKLADWLPSHKVLSLGMVDGRNIWRTDVDTALQQINRVQQRFHGEVWLAPSCSLLHVPVDVQQETALTPQLQSWLAFARQKLDEVVLLQRVLNRGEQDQAAALQQARAIQQDRQAATCNRQADVRARLDSIVPQMRQRQSVYAERIVAQQQWLDLPLFPTTTIGSFPQTGEIRQTRRQLKNGEISVQAYNDRMKQEIADVIRKQEQLGLDVLVHGEPERNDMVEYFGEQLNGFAFTRHGLVQSYGSRCVKPPIIYGDVSRDKPMTVDWAVYAQSLSNKPVKGMLTGPVTILNWSFVRDDQPRDITCQQIALALRDEVLDLERAGIGIIQIDEAALREGLPLRKADWQHYLDWAVAAFQLTANGVADHTQIHTHMCYSEFNDIIEAVAAMDADVITIETSRSDMELLQAFEDFVYPNEIGPGVYDIHSPNVPTLEQMVTLMHKAAEYIPVERLWVNPDCGLKTRGWPEVEAALQNMVRAARQLRQDFAAKAQALN